MPKNRFSIRNLMHDSYMVVSYMKKVLEKCDFTGEQIKEYEEYCNAYPKQVIFVSKGLIDKCNDIYQEKYEREKENADKKTCR